MKSPIYRRTDGLVIARQADDWAVIYPPGAQKGIALDPLMFAIWSVTEGQTTTDLAQNLHISTYLAFCALAVLQRAGLLQAESPAMPSPLTHAAIDATRSSAAFVIHHYPQADLAACLDSLREQHELGLAEITVIAMQPLPIEVENVHLIQCDDWLTALSEWLTQVEAEAVLLLDSRVRLTPGALSEMTHALTLRDDIAAVAPRVMWEQWPHFVVSVGERDGANECASCTGHLDVGQFKRWREVHSICPTGGLLRRDMLQQMEISSEVAPEQAIRNWSHRIRWQGYHILSALQAIAYGPWPDNLVHEDDVLTLYQGMPSLTVENVRGLYSHYAAITPLSLQQNTSAGLWPYTSHTFEEASEIVGKDDSNPLRPHQPVSSAPTPLLALPGKAWRILRRQGLGGVGREVRRYIRWKVGG